jgi:alanyl-tRNA synthetase
LSHDPAFHRDPFLEELDTEVIDTGEEEGRAYAVLADTLFYPEGGGQPADHGQLNESLVIDVQKHGSRIRHYLDHPVQTGPAHLVLDWRRRWDHMQQHTAQHVLTAVALRDFEWRTTAFHLGPETSNIELDVEKLERRDLDQLEQAVADEIRADRRVTYKEAQVEDFDRLGVRSRRLPEGFAGTVRLVDIEGLDLNTCGGTHLRSTAEIGTLCLLGTETMRGGNRVFFVAGDRVRSRMAAHEARNQQLRSLLDTGDDELAEVVSLRIAREKDLARTARRLSEELAEAAALSLVTRPDPAVDAHWDERDMAFLQKVARTLAETCPAKAALLTAEPGDGAVFAVFAGGASGIDLAEIGPRIAETLGGRGGGRSPIFQGKAESLANRDEALRILRDG